MSEQSLNNLNDVKEYIKTAEAGWKPEVYKIDREIVQRFTQAIGDANPLWQGEGFTPPTLLSIIGAEQSCHMSAFTPAETGARGGLHRGTELECYMPVRIGDEITITDKVLDVHEEQGKRMGQRVSLTLERTYKNQRRELVARCRQIINIFI
jgi:hydroxyacyl-ACP dehydratase HTD2-like protein with hotdog domain